jgi:hypothetical protein
MVRLSAYVKVTRDGFDVLEEYEKSWLTKAIDKEPITFLQVIITIATSLATWIIGLVMGYKWSDTITHWINLLSRH